MPSASELPPFMSGELDRVTLPELVQMFATGGHAVRIALVASDGRRGTVTIDDGSVNQCRFGELLGEDAFYALCRISGQFMVSHTDPDRLRRSEVRRGWQELLMEAARLEDEEAARASRPAPEPVAALPRAAPVPELAWPPAESTPASPKTVLRAVPPVEESEPPPAEPSATPEDDGFDALFSAATRAYVLRQLDEAEALFRRCEALRPEDSRVRTNLKRLVERRKGRR